jgi:hypothetical protein
MRVLRTVTAASLPGFVAHPESTKAPAETPAPINPLLLHVIVVTSNFVCLRLQLLKPSRTVCFAVLD